jgi:hypothetical protein
MSKEAITFEPLEVQLRRRATARRLENRSHVNAAFCRDDQILESSMFESGSLVALLGSLLAVAASAALFVVAAGHAANRFGRPGVVAAWVITAALVALAIAMRLQARQAALGFVPNETRDAGTLATFTVLSFVAFGAAAVVAWRHHRGSAKLTGRAVLSGVAAFLGAAIAVFVAILVMDILRFAAR